jgi:mannose-6-phosphate isomerase-like protein (cupin superfamily)
MPKTVCRERGYAPGVDPTPAPIDLGADFVGIGWDGSARALEGPGPPPRIDGITVGTWITDGRAPHGGERHDDGDEVLVLVSGAVTVVLETDAGAEAVDVTPGHAVVVPRGVWHRVVVRQRSHIVFLTPGPAFAARPA